MVILSREDKQKKAFYVFDIFTSKFLRKFKKIEKLEDSDAFDVDGDLKYVVYALGNEIVFHSCKIPDSLQKYIRFKYKSSDLKENPAKISM
jgi:hypothetical protein